jgi:hypothetical protein
MLHEIFGAALIGMSALTVYARVMARSAELRQRAPHSMASPPALSGQESGVVASS